MAALEVIPTSQLILHTSDSSLRSSNLQILSELSCARSFDSPSVAASRRAMHRLGAKRRISGGVAMNSTSTPPAASPAASLDAFHLPLISLDSTTLTLMSCNTSASRVLGDAALRVGSTTAVDLLSKQPQPGWRNEMRSLLDNLVQTTVKVTGDSYGHGTPLQLWTSGKDGQRLSYSAEVLCVLNRSPTIHDSSTYDILLLRNISTEYRAFTTADDGSNSAPSDSGRASTRSIRSRSIGGGDGDLEPEVLSKFDEVFRRVGEKTEATARIGGGLDLPEHDLVKVLDAFPTIAFVADAVRVAQNLTAVHAADHKSFVQAGSTEFCALKSKVVKCRTDASGLQQGPVDGSSTLVSHLTLPPGLELFIRASWRAASLTGRAKSPRGLLAKFTGRCEHLPSAFLYLRLTLLSQPVPYQEQGRDLAVVLMRRKADRERRSGCTMGRYHHGRPRSGASEGRSVEKSGTLRRRDGFLSSVLASHWS